MRDRSLIAGCLAGVLLFSLSMAAVSIREFRRHEEYQRRVEHTQQVLRNVEAHRFAQKAAESSRRRYVITGDPRDADERQASVEALRRAISELIRLTAGDPVQHERALELERRSEEALDAGARMIAARRAGNLAEARRMVLARESGAPGDAALAAARALGDEELRLLEEHLSARKKSARGSTLALAGSLAAALLSALLAVVLLRRESARRRRSDAELERARQLSTAMLDNIQASVYLMDLEGRLRMVNRECARALGTVPEKAAGRHVLDFLPAADVEKVLDNNRRIHASGELSIVEETVKSADGVRVYQSRKRPIPPGLFSEPAICGVSVDVTEDKERERKLLEVNAELEAFTYSVSHDLRAPLRAIDGFARILAEDRADSLDAEARRLIGLVRGNALRMGRLIDDLLAFSRLGRQEFRRTEVDMNELARQAAEEAAAGESGREVRLLLADLPPVEGDRAMLAQVWRNLFLNAYKYTRLAAAPAIEVGARGVSDEVEYWIKDNGVGFDPRYAHKLFGVFQRLHAAEEFEGTGVGLALVRRVVERHGGRVAATGAKGAGATIRFSLPRKSS